MDLASFRALLAPAGQAALRASVELNPREEDFLRHYTVLERRFAPQVARAALEMAIWRLRATTKFPAAERMYFTREALEQASAWEVATYRAQRYRPFALATDLGCSIGGDTLALASVLPTVGIDLDPLRLAMAHANLQSLDLEAVFLQADLRVPLPLSTAALFFDPARRVGGRRLFSVEDYLPPLSIVKEWLPHFPALGVKISPGVDYAELMEYTAEAEFISLRGELKEAVLWFGGLQTTRRRATILPGPHTLWDDSVLQDEAHTLSRPQQYLYEPDASILRAGLVVKLADQLGAAQLDASIAYLTSDEVIDTPFARVWKVEEWFPFSLKRLKGYLRARGVGRVVVKKRGSPLQPEQLIQALHLQGENERLVFLTQMRGHPIVVVCFAGVADLLAS